MANWARVGRVKKVMIESQGLFEAYQADMESFCGTLNTYTGLI